MTGCERDSFFIPIGREHRLEQLCHITQYATPAQQSPYKELFTRGPYRFLAGGVLC